MDVWLHQFSRGHLIAANLRSEDYDSTDFSAFLIKRRLDFTLLTHIIRTQITWPSPTYAPPSGTFNSGQFG